VNKEPKKQEKIIGINSFVILCNQILESVLHHNISDQHINY